MALNVQEWRRSVTQCVHMDAGWIKVKVKDLGQGQGQVQGQVQGQGCSEMTLTYSSSHLNVCRL